MVGTMEEHIRLQEGDISVSGMDIVCIGFETLSPHHLTKLLLQFLASICYDHRNLLNPKQYWVHYLSHPLFPQRVLLKFSIYRRAWKS